MVPLDKDLLVDATRTDDTAIRDQERRLSDETITCIFHHHENNSTIVPSIEKRSVTS